MVRFIETFESINESRSRKMNLSDMGLGDFSMKIIAEIVA